MIKLLQFLVFLPLQILFIPFVILGAIPAIFKEMVVSKKLGVSFTAGQAIQARWIMHYLGTREDKATVEFIKSFPIESHWGFMGFMGAAIIANRICGYKPSIGRIPEPGKEGTVSFVNTRTAHFDRIMEQNLNHVDQVVIMGAGFDLRVLKYSEGKKLKVFELDQEKTQNLKIETMDKASIAHDWVTYIPINFRNESWVEKLIEGGFDKTKKTFFLWESVSLYLDADVVMNTLKKLADLCVKGSIIAQDFYSRAYISGETAAYVKRSLSTMEKMGEPWLYGIDMSEDAGKAIESLLQEAGLKLKSLILCGGKGKTGKPFYAITEAEKR